MTDPHILHIKEMKNFPGNFELKKNSLNLKFIKC